MLAYNTERWDRYLRINIAALLIFYAACLMFGVWGRGGS